MADGDQTPPLPLEAPCEQTKHLPPDECCFELAKITSQLTKYPHGIASLPATVVDEDAAIVAAFSAALLSRQYDQIKGALLEPLPCLSSHVCGKCCPWKSSVTSTRQGYKRAIRSIRCVPAAQLALVARLAGTSAESRHRAAPTPVSILPAARSEQSSTSGTMYIQSVNGIRIPVYKQRSLTGNLGLQRAWRYFNAENPELDHFLIPPTSLNLEEVTLQPASFVDVGRPSKTPHNNCAKHSHILNDYRRFSLPCS
ncbi:hypothetical protein HPB48_004433 [Haemaphysalis longicornis]|uniref:Uncharacterized protein n=1 Tax=Haemaphysalis longicornis TaxID=44386 RepID=A0A9J6GWX1_HAELO|nr:hypothetical protein HPB48_004433 [Haemaphysalis longicornis]